MELHDNLIVIIIALLDIIAVAYFLYIGYTIIDFITKQSYCSLPSQEFSNIPLIILVCILVTMCALFIFVRQGDDNNE